MKKINLKNEIAEAIKNGMKPENSRYGQYVFNYIDQVYGVARTVQFDERIDCFYDDGKVDEFIAVAETIINEIIDHVNSEEAKAAEKNDNINE